MQKFKDQLGPAPLTKSKIADRSDLGTSRAEVSLRSRIFSRDNRFASSWSPEFGLFPGRSSADLRRSHGRLPIAPVPLSLVHGHPLAEKNCWRPLRTYAPFLSTVIAVRPHIQHHESVRAPVN